MSSFENGNPLKKVFGFGTVEAGRAVIRAATAQSSETSILTHAEREILEVVLKEIARAQQTGLITGNDHVIGARL